DLTIDALSELVVALGEPPYRARQLFHWLHARAADRWEMMSDLPAALRTRLAAERRLCPVDVARHLTSADGLTSKLLLRLADGEQVESVIMDTGGSAGARQR